MQKTKKKTKKNAILFLPMKKYLFLEYDMVKMTGYKTFLKVFFKFGNVKIKKLNSHCSKEEINLVDVHIEKILLFNAFACGKNKETGAKCFIRYKACTGNRVFQCSRRNPLLVTKYKELLEKY